MTTSKTRVGLGFCAVALSVLVVGFWSAWGTIENFHEGWYQRSLTDNLKLALIQYVCWPIGFALLAAIGVWKPRIGACLFALIGLTLNAFLFGFRNRVGFELILVPCILLAGLFGFGRVPRPKIAIAVVIGVPLTVIVGFGTPLAWKVSHRLTAIADQPLVWKTRSEALVWAPPGPGWPDSGVSYREAVAICDRLDRDGRSLAVEPQHLWRLPKVDEAIRALNRGGRPSGCTYRGPNRFQPCRVEPDKEAPLWNPFSQVIYWWTGSDDSKARNLRVAYNGFVLPVGKGPSSYTGFRAVRR